jgi:hypothetical protein
VVSLRLGQIFLFSKISRLALGPSQAPIQWMSGTCSLGLNWPWHEADHSSPSNADIMSVCISPKP